MRFIRVRQSRFAPFFFFLPSPSSMTLLPTYALSTHAHHIYFDHEENNNLQELLLDFGAYFCHFDGFWL